MRAIVQAMGALGRLKLTAGVAALRAAELGVWLSLPLLLAALLLSLERLQELR